MTIEVNGLHHFLIRVQDPDASRAFYEQTFGFSFIELPVDADFVRAWRGHPSEGKLLATPLGDTFLVLAPPLEGTAEDDRFNERRSASTIWRSAFRMPTHWRKSSPALELAGVRTAGDRTRSGAGQVVRRVPGSRQRAMGVLRLCVDATGRHGSIELVLHNTCLTTQKHAKVENALRLELHSSRTCDRGPKGPTRTNSSRFHEPHYWPPT